MIGWWKPWHGYFFKNSLGFSIYDIWMRCFKQCNVWLDEEPLMTLGCLKIIQVIMNHLHKIIPAVLQKTGPLCLLCLLCTLTRCFLMKVQLTTCGTITYDWCTGLGVLFTLKTSFPAKCWIGADVFNNDHWPVHNVLSEVFIIKHGKSHSFWVSS